MQDPAFIDSYEEAALTEIRTVQVQRAVITVSLVMWLFNQIPSWGWPYNHLSEVQCVIRRDCLLLTGREGIHLPDCHSSALALTTSHSHMRRTMKWKQDRPPHACALSAACEGGVSIRELCCCAVQKKREGTHYTMQPGAILIPLSLSTWLKKLRFL